MVVIVVVTIIILVYIHKFTLKQLIYISININI